MNLVYHGMAPIHIILTKIYMSSVYRYHMICSICVMNHRVLSQWYSMLDCSTYQKKKIHTFDVQPNMGTKFVLKEYLLSILGSGTAARFLHDAERKKLGTCHQFIYQSNRYLSVQLSIRGNSQFDILFLKALWHEKKLLNDLVSHMQWISII